jgi:hypothetical protein
MDSDGNVWVNIVSDNFRKINPDNFSNEVKKSLATGVAKSSIEKVFIERGEFLIIEVV